MLVSDQSGIPRKAELEMSKVYFLKFIMQCGPHGENSGNKIPMSLVGCLAFRGKGPYDIMFKKIFFCIKIFIL